MMKGGDNIHSQAKEGPEVKRVSRPGRYSMRNKGPINPLAARRHRPGLPAPNMVMRHTSTEMPAQPLEGDVLSVAV